MRIFQINCVYKVGSTGKIVDCIGNVLRSRGHEVYTCYGIGEKFYDNYSQKICYNLEHRFNALLMRLRGIPYGGVFVSNWKFKQIIKCFQPDVVHVHCINASMINVYSLLKYLANNQIKTVVTLHAEIYHTAGCEHAYDCEKYKTYCHHCELNQRKRTSWLFDRTKESWQKMYNAFNRFDSNNIIITAVSPWLADRARQSAILRTFKIEYVPNGVNTSIFYYRNNVGLIDRKTYKKIILFVTPFFNHEETDVKGGRFIPLMAEMLPDYLFVVVSSRTARRLRPMPVNVLLWGAVKNQEELAQLYSEADVTLLLSRRETFSMVTAESLCCGTPVVGFKAGGPESVAPKDFCHFVEFGDLSNMSKIIREVFATDKQVISNQCIATFSKESMAGHYLMTYRSLVS